MPSLMDRIAEFLKPKKQEADRAPATNGGGAVATPGAPPPAREIDVSKPATKKRPAKKAAAKKKPAATKSAAKGKVKTREQLYKEATRLKIAGRSKMSKAQLERAIANKKK
jgi:hypothetical protein